MKKILPSVLLILVLFTKTYSQNIPPGCPAAAAFCAGTSAAGLTFPNTTGAPSVGQNSCLSTQPNPAWYYLRISQAGNLTFTITQRNNAGALIDVDFIAWGPFSAPSCGPTSLTTANQVGCSYSVSATETFTINNAQVGQYYMVLMTNFRDQPGSISLAQSSGSGATDCDIVCPLTVTGGDVSDCAYTTLAAKYLNSSVTQSTFQWTFNGVNIAAPSGVGITSVITTPPGTVGTTNTLGPLGTNTSNPQILTSGNYCVTARSPGCSTTQSAVCTTINPGLPIPYNPPIDISVCTGSTFNLTQNTNVLLNGLPGGVSNYRVRYNINQANALANTGHISNSPIASIRESAFPGTEGQIIYATITDNTQQKCLTVAQFTLRFQSCTFVTTNSGPICSGGTFNLSATDPGVGPVTYSWTGPNGFTATGANVTNVPTPSGTPPFIYVCTATPSTVGVGPLTSTTTVTVNPIPQATASSGSNSICSGSTTNISLVSNVAGTSFAWNVVNTNAYGSSSGVGGSISQTLFSTNNTVGTVIYTITPTASGCIGLPIISAISVKPIPVAVATSSLARLCSGSTSTIVLSSTPAGATFVWTATQTDAMGASVGSGTTIAQVLTAPGNLTGTVDYTIIPILNDCSGLPIHSLISVDPQLLILTNPIATQTICSGTEATLLSVVAANSESLSYQWFYNSTNSTTGGILIAAATTATHTPQNSTIGNYYYYCIVSGSCGTVSSSIAEVIVIPQITPTFNQVEAICLGTIITPLPTTSNNGITGTWSHAINNSETTTYTFTPDTGQCAVTTAQTITITLPKITSEISFLAPVASLPNVTIGTQVWTSKNLDVATYRDGTPIPQVTDPTQWSTLTTGAWCYHNNDPANGAIYGKLYNWYAVVGIYDAASLNDPTLRKPIAPLGWHIPSDGEWTTLTDYLGGASVAGGKMKETGNSHWISPNLGATNSSGFTGLPGDYRMFDGRFNIIGYQGGWWSSSEYSNAIGAWNRSLVYHYGVLNRSPYFKTAGYSVRLIKD
jgi:uncharacterized protein (TIGR02145 family)